MCKYSIRKQSPGGRGGFVVKDKKTGRVVKQFPNRKKAKKFIKKISE